MNDATAGRESSWHLSVKQEIKRPVFVTDGPVVCVKFEQNSYNVLRLKYDQITGAYTQTIYCGSIVHKPAVTLLFSGYQNVDFGRIR